MPPPPLIFMDPRVAATSSMTQEQHLTYWETLFRSHRTAPEVRVLTLPAADIAFTGHGPDPDCPAMIGVERKSLRDMLSSMRTGRFSGEQLVKLLPLYNFIYLVVEGVWRVSGDGLIETPYNDAGNRGWRALHLGSQRTPFHAQELYGFLNTISTHTPIIVHHTNSPRDTVNYVMSLHHYFGKPWDKHSAHLSVHIPAPPVVQIGKVGTVRRVAYVLDGIGWEKSGVVASHFPSVRAMAEAGPEEWRKLPGFGKVISERVVKDLNGEH